MHNPKLYKHSDHLIICDSCGAQRYRSECDYTWDGYLMCHVLNCWYDKHPLFEMLPVINDPTPVYDTRPDQVSGTETYVDNVVGLITTFGSIHQTWNSLHEQFGDIDSPPDYWS